MDIAAALQANAPTQRTRACIVQRALDTIPTDTPGRDDLIAAIADDTTWPASNIARILGALGHPVSATTVRSHRGRRCPCTVGS